MGKKSIFNANFAKAQKSMDISRAKELLKSNLLAVHEDSENFTERDAQYLERMMNLLTQVRKFREKEVALLYSDCEELYLTKKFELAENILGFAETIVERSGLHNWRTKIQILNRKIKRSRNTVEKMRNFYSNNPMSLPILQIQHNYENLEILFQEVQGDNSRQDSIHPEIITEFENILLDMEKFMKSHGIPKLNHLDKKTTTIWASTKASLDLKSKETKLKRIINAASKNENHEEAKAGILKAYKLIQENPYLFSLQQKQEIIDLLDEYGQKFHAASEIQADLLRELDTLIMALQFDRALMKLDEHRDANIKVLTTEELDELDRTHERITINQNIFLKLQAVETRLDHNDVLSAKTAFIKFNKFFNNLSQSVIVISPLENRISLLLIALGEYSTDEIKKPVASRDFDPFSEEECENDKVEKNEVENLAIVKDIEKKKKSGKKKDPRKNKGNKKKREFEISEICEDTPSKELFTKFKNIMEKQGQISKQELATTLNISEDEVFTNLFSWKKRCEFEVVGSEIFSKAAISSPSSKQSASPKSSKDSTFSDSLFDGDSLTEEELLAGKEEKEEDILETLDDLLSTDL
ncbi:MAG: hypothetical protein ACTSRK_18850 [Promethearchaeota archaeon]